MVASISVLVSYERADGVKVSRQVTVTKSMYDKAPMATFKKNAARRALEAVNAVLGVKPGVVIEEG